jgi:protein phosphatase
MKADRSDPDDHTHHDEAWRRVISGPLDVAGVQPLSSIVELDVGAVSSSGHGQPYNTDHYLALRLSRVQETIITSLAAADLPPRFEETAYALLVADGFDEASGGARASRLALSSLAHLAIEYGRWNVRVGPNTAADVIQQGEFFYRQVNEALRSARASNGRLAAMATSLTAAYIAGAHLFFSHVGHSKMFLFRQGVLTPLTRDHTVEQLLRANEQPKSPERASSDLHHRVTETIGGRHDGPDVAIEQVQLWTGDRILLCTNGLTDVVPANAIADILAARRYAGEDSQRLVDCALAAHAADNVTALVADYSIRPPAVIIQPGHVR